MADNDPPLWVIGDSPGKGRGVFATASLNEGTKTWEESPLVVSTLHTPIDIFMSYENASRGDAQVEELYTSLTHVGHLPPRTSPAEVIDIGKDPNPGTLLEWVEGKIFESNSIVNDDSITTGQRILRYPGVDFSGAPEIVAIFHNNCFKMPRETNNNGCPVGVFFTAAHLNHSCVPNCNAAWNQEAGTLSVYAVREIEASEELVITYFPNQLLLTSREKRLDVLKRRWDFDCTCAACDATSSTGINRETMATIISRIKAIKQGVDPWTRSRVPGATRVDDSRRPQYLAEGYSVSSISSSLLRSNAKHDPDSYLRHMELADFYEKHGAKQAAGLELFKAEDIAKTSLGGDHPMTKAIWKAM